MPRVVGCDELDRSGRDLGAAVAAGDARRLTVAVIHETPQLVLAFLTQCLKGVLYLEAPAIALENGAL
ncbi:hypothetical protein lerEdw1_000622 [Lerista edwardsae]|nr:hypothetical protein lerEdw1_000622 [Lerista edwardsae]